MINAVRSVYLRIGPNYWICEDVEIFLSLSLKFSIQMRYGK
jgi:hypothetical protein